MFTKFISSLPLILAFIAMPSHGTMEDTQSLMRPQTTGEYFSNLSLDLHSKGDEAVGSDSIELRDMPECKEVLANGLQVLPSFHMLSLNDLTLNFEQKGKRGLAGAGDLIIRCDIKTDQELLAVFIHEMGHVVDGNALTGTSSEKSGFVDLGIKVSVDDPSSTFYKYSWKNDNTLLPDMPKSSFCSTYGMTDPYEDFAECYVYYVLHGKEFRNRIETDSVLNKKYDFMKNYVFFGREYLYDEDFAFTGLTEFRNEVVYDITKLPYSYELI